MLGNEKRWQREVELYRVGKKTEKMPGGLGKWEWRDYKRMREGESKGICSDVEGWSRLQARYL